MVKRKKIFGITGAETVRAISVLDDLLERLNKLIAPNEIIVSETFSTESEEQEELVVDAESVRERVRSLRDDLAAQKSGPSHFSFSDPGITLDDWNILPGQRLLLRPDFGQLVAQSKAQGSSDYMSSTDLSRHLNMLDDMVPLGNEASARLRIDAVFFRAYALVKPSHMVLSVEHRTPPTLVTSAPRATLVSGFVDYTAFVTSKAEVHQRIMWGGNSFTKAGSDATGIFVAEAKSSLSLSDNLPQVVMEMYGLAKQYKKNIIRGALSTGVEWFFIILHLSDAQEGGHYSTSTWLPRDISGKIDSDLIAGIVAHWIQHGFEDLGPDDWFEFSDSSR